MSYNAFGGFFLGDADEDVVTGSQGVISVPPVVPGPSPVPTAPEPAVPEITVPLVQPIAPAISVPLVQPVGPSISVPPVQPRMTREQRLVLTLDRLMEENREIEAAALVSLDGFTMASALPEGMHEDRVGAMSAAILGLGERAATELGRGHLSQVFIEGASGYVMLIAAGDRAVLTCLAGRQAKLGLVLYDMREAADGIAEILG